MKVRHLDCAPMRPLGGGRPIGSDAQIGSGRMVGHVLVIESNDGLVLVDSGFGLGDVAHPARLGRLFLAFGRPQLREENTALRQLAALGHRPSDVRHVILTHLDVDHAGGMSDFPAAQIHVHSDELDSALHPQTSWERKRYRAHHWAHGPRWTPHTSAPGAGSDTWLGLSAVRPLPGVAPELLLVPLYGHSRGHLGVAVKTDGGWQLHCGDAYFHRDQMTAAPRCPFGLALFQRIDDHDRAARVDTQRRLRELSVAHPEVRRFCAHDPVELARAQADLYAGAACPPAPTS